MADREREHENLPSTAPAPTSGGKHFTFDKPQSPKSARYSDKSRTCFTFKDEAEQRNQQSRLTKCEEDKKMPLKESQQMYDKSQTARTHPSQINANMNGQSSAVVGRLNNSKKSRTEDRNRYSVGAAIASTGHKTSPKHERRRSPSSSTSKVNSAPPNMKESNFFGNNTSPTRLNTKPLSPTSQTSSSGQRKYSSSSSSGGSERYKDAMLFPFDREAIDYERIQRECFALKENSSSSPTTSDSDEAEPCSVYERSKATISPKPTDFYKQYTLFSQNEQQQLRHQASSRKSSKRLRSDSSAPKHIPTTDAFSPKSKSSSPTQNAYQSPNSQVELNKFEDIASKFDQMPPKHGSIVSLSAKTTTSQSGCNQLTSFKNNNNTINSNNNIESISSSVSSPSNSRSTTPPLPNLRVDFFMEKSKKYSHKKSFKNKANGCSGSGTVGGKAAAGIELVGAIASASTTHELLGDCQHIAANSTSSIANSGGPINVTPNPMEVAVCTQPRATIVVQQVSTAST